MTARKFATECFGIQNGCHTNQKIELRSTSNLTSLNIFKTLQNMADDEDIAALVIDNGSGMCKGEWKHRNHFSWHEGTVDSLAL
jgi:hypothetical protein